MMQYPHWDANLLVVIATAVSVGAVVLVHYEGLAVISAWLAKRREQISRRKVLYGIFSVLALHIMEIWIFGITVWLLLKYPDTGIVTGANPLQFFDAIYLAAVTYTTVGFGDVAPIGPIRFIAGTMSLTGFVLITWSASFTYLEMERYWRK
jgi:uncharacterized protein YhhL (DUF1145 family)